MKYALDVCFAINAKSPFSVTCEPPIMGQFITIPHSEWEPNVSCYCFLKRIYSHLIYMVDPLSYGKVPNEFSTMFIELSTTLAIVVGLTQLTGDHHIDQVVIIAQISHWSISTKWKAFICCLICFNRWAFMEWRPLGDKWRAASVGHPVDDSAGSNVQTWWVRKAARDPLFAEHIRRSAHS